MKTKFLGLIISIILGSSYLTNAQTKIKMVHLKPLMGNWTGSLTYLDYKSNKPYTMPANIEIRKIKKSNSLLVTNIYPNEPKANSTDTLVISNNGTMLNNNSVVINKILENGNRQIVTTFNGKDGNDYKPASIRITYTISNATYSIKKEVQFENTTTWILRHEYSYTKK